MKLIIVLLLVLAACEFKQFKNESEIEEASYTRYIDKELGVACYHHFVGGVSCVKIK